MEDATNGEIYELLKNILAKTDNIEKQIVSNKKELTDEIRNIKSEIKQEVEELKQENRNIKQENQELKLKLAAIERRIKKNNLVFYGVEENIHKKEVEKVLQIISEKLELHCDYVDIKDCFKIGQIKEGKTRPIVVEFANHRLKTEVLTNSKKLKGSGIFVQHDYTTEDYQQRKILLKHLKVARDNDLKAVIKNNILIVEGEQYTYENLVSQAEILGKKGEGTRNTQKEKNNINEDIRKTQVERNDAEVFSIIAESSEQSADPENKEHTRDKISFKELVNTASKAKKRKEQPTDSSNQIKRFTRLNKQMEEK